MIGELVPLPQKSIFCFLIGAVKMLSCRWMEAYFMNQMKLLRNDNLI